MAFSQEICACLWCRKNTKTQNKNKVTIVKNSENPGLVTDAIGPVPDIPGVPEGVYSVLKAKQTIVSQENLKKTTTETKRTEERKSSEKALASG